MWWLSAWQLCTAQANDVVCVASIRDSGDGRLHDNYVNVTTSQRNNDPKQHKPETSLIHAIALPKDLD